MPPLQVASLATKHRLLQSLAAAWPRRLDGQLALASGRRGVLQALCSAVEERQAAGAGEHAAGSIGGALWHGLKVAFDQVWLGLVAGCAPGCLLLRRHSGRVSGRLPVCKSAVATYRNRTRPPLLTARRSTVWATACGASGFSCWQQS